jgi:hypothetical protein
MATFLIAKRAKLLTGSMKSQWRHFSWLKGLILSRAPGTVMATFLMAQWRPTSHGFTEKNSHGDVSHGPKGGQLSKMVCYLWLNGANSHGTQSDIMLTDVAKAD